MKVLISEAHSASNIGDLELVVRSIAVARKRFLGAAFACSATDPMSFEGLIESDVEMRASVFSRLEYIGSNKLSKATFVVGILGLMTVVSGAALLGRWALIRVLDGLSSFSGSAAKLREMIRSDAIVAVGGGYFGNSYWKHSVITLWTWWVAGRAGISVETMPISMEITTPWLRRMVNRFGRCVKWRLRDSLSVERLRACGLAGERVPDLAFMNFSDALAVPDTGRKGNLLIALVGSDYLNPETADRLYRSLASNCRTHFPGYQVNLLAMHKPMQKTSVGGDVLAAEICAAYLFDNGMEASIVSADKFEDVLELCSRSEFVISARMHAGIAALCSGSRVGLLAYESKHFALMNDLSLGKHVISIDADDDALSSMMSELKTANRSDFVEKVREFKLSLVDALR